MGKQQGTITSFFRPAGSSAGKKVKAPAKCSPDLSPGTKKRPRPESAVSKASDNAESLPSKGNSERSVKRSKSDMASKPSAGKKPAKDSDDDVVDVEKAADVVNVDKDTAKESPAEDDVVDLTQDSGDSGDRENASDSDDEEEVPKKKNSNKTPKLSSPEESRSVSRLHLPKTWKGGKPVPYKYLADVFSKVEEISGRLEIQAILSELFRNIITFTPEDLVPAIYLCVNKLAPAHEGIELGIGESILIKALSQVTGRTVPALKSLYKEVGDLGDVASSARTNQKTMFPPPPLSVRKVYQEFKAIAAITGKNTQETKRAKIVKLLVASSTTEAKFVARALLGKLRIHLADKTVIAALAAAMTLERLNVNTDVLLTKDGKKKAKMSSREEDIESAIADASEILGSVYSQLPVWNVIIPKLLKLKSIDERLKEECKLMPGIPVSPMLAKPTKAISEVLERFSERSFTCEFKYDGERAQVHRLQDGTMKIYSRNAENLTPKYPDLVAALPRALSNEYKDSSFIVDAEAVAYDMEKKKILPFQELQGRKRKDVDADHVTVKVCIFAFDLLFFDGKSLIEKSFATRRQRLMEGFTEQEGEFMFAKGEDSKDPEEIMNLLNRSIKEGCEGLMVKALEGSHSTYEPNNRSQNWLKVKKDYLEGCGDSLDLVPIGGYLGRGKRTGIYGAFLLACYDPETEEYQSICKIGTGFSEEVLDNFAKFYNDPDAENKSENAKSYYRTPALKTLEPDVWFEPVQVWEVKCADLSISPQHMAAVGHIDPDKGIALRFPRFVRIRDDKKPDEATSAEQVAEFYMRQSSVANNAYVATGRIR